jgi:hypothetical protein
MTYRILNFPDMTTEGSFPLGGAVCVTAITNGVSPIKQHHRVQSRHNEYSSKDDRDLSFCIQHAGNKTCAHSSDDSYILNFPDMTTEGSFPLGGAVCVTAITNGVSPIFATLLGEILDLWLL